MSPSTSKSAPSSSLSSRTFPTAMSMTKSIVVGRARFAIDRTGQTSADEIGRGQPSPAPPRPAYAMSTTSSRPVAHPGRPANTRRAYLGTIKAFGEFLAKLVVRECAVGMRLFDAGDGKLSRGSRQAEADRESSFGPCLAQELEVSGVCLGRGVAHEGQFTTRDAACAACLKVSSGPSASFRPCSKAGRSCLREHRQLLAQGARSGGQRE